LQGFHDAEGIVSFKGSLKKIGASRGKVCKKEDRASRVH